MTSLETIQIVETITVEQFNVMVERMAEDGFNPNWFGPCFIINFEPEGSISFMPAHPKEKTFNWTVTYDAPWTVGLMACLMVV